MSVQFSVPHSTLSPEAVREVFRREGLEGFELQKSPFPDADFALRRSPWTAVAVRVSQDGPDTRLVVASFVPGEARRRLMPASLVRMVAGKKWDEAEQEVARFITTRPEFNPAQGPRAFAKQVPVPVDGPDASKPPGLGAGAVREGAAKVHCPRCNAPFSISAVRPVRVTCPSCDLVASMS